MAAAPTSPRRDLFGDVAVALGMLTWAQVRDILKRQVKYRELGIPIRIGELSIEMGLLTQSQCNQILSTQREKRKDLEEEKKQPEEEEESELQDPEEGEPVQLGHFKLTKRLGGVMGVVYGGVDEANGIPVALKVLPKHLTHDKAFVERFKREVRATGTLSHPNIVNIYDAGIENGVFYLAMEFVDGETLNQRLRREGRLTEPLGLHVGREVAKGLDHAHSHGILHRDVKPENIMLAKSGGVKLADLGLAKFLEDSQRITAEGIAVGTPHYISPEQARALKETDHRTDLYSLGATLFHVLTGRLPYEGDNGAEVMKRHVFEPTPDPRSVKADMTPAVADMIVKLMAKNPNQRFQTAAELATHIDGLIKAAKGTAGSDQSSSRLTPRKKFDA
jgi:serine/threonine protein kinase